MPYLPRFVVVRLSITVTAALVLWLGQAGSGGRAVAAPPTVNACGCGRDTIGACFCQKVARCGCPGDCEPKGCEEKRQRQLEKEIEVETKRAAADDRKRNAAFSSRAERSSDGADSEDEAPKGKAGPGRTDAGGFAARPAKVAAVRRMSSAQKKELAHLLAAYLAENPERRARTVEQVREDLD